MIGEYGQERETATSLNELHGRLVELSEEYLHYDIADDYLDFEGFSAYARTCLVEIPGQVSRYLYQLADETGDERLAELAKDIKTYQYESARPIPLSARAASCVCASKELASVPTPRPLPTRMAVERS